MSIKITIPNSSSDVLTFGSGNTPTAAQIAGIDSGSSNGQLALYTTASGTSTERVRVDSSGNVVIGDTSTSGKFKVAVADNASFQTAGNFTNNINADFKIRVKSSVTDLGPSTSTPLTFSIGGSERMRIDSSGNLLVGTTSATSGYLLKVAGAIHATGNHALGYSGNEFNFCGATQVSGDVYMNYRNSATAITTYRFMNGTGGTTYAACVATSFTPSSDYRIKTDVQNESDALEKVLNLRPVNYIKDNASEREHGLIAHEVAEIFPDLVGGEGKDAVDDEGDMVIQTVNYMGLTSILVKAIKEQQAIITSLTDRITALEGAK